MELFIDIDRRCRVKGASDNSIDESPLEFIQGDTEPCRISLLYGWDGSAYSHKAVAANDALRVAIGQPTSAEMLAYGDSHTTDGNVHTVKLLVNSTELAGALNGKKSIGAYFEVEFEPYGAEALTGEVSTFLCEKCKVFNAVIDVDGPAPELVQPFAAFKQACEDAQEAAELAQGKAEDAQEAAETAASAGEGHKEAAENAEENALYYAQSAQSSAREAQEANDAAGASSQVAAQSAKDAKEFARIAGEASDSVAGALRKENNLSDVPNKAAARANLGTYDKVGGVSISESQEQLDFHGEVIINRDQISLAEYNTFNSVNIRGEGVSAITNVGADISASVKVQFDNQKGALITPEKIYIDDADGNSAEITSAGKGSFTDLEITDSTKKAGVRTNLDVYSKSEVDSAVGVVDGAALKKAQNLADLPSAETARTNLNVYSKSEVYQKVSKVRIDSNDGIELNSDEMTIGINDEHIEIYSGDSDESAFFANDRIEFTDGVNTSTIRPSGAEFPLVESGEASFADLEITDAQNREAFAVSIGALPEINTETELTSKTIASLGGGVVYELGELTALTISAVVASFRESQIWFTSGATATTFTYPNSLKWIGGVPTIEANKSYVIAVVNGVAAIGEIA